MGALRARRWLCGWLVCAGLACALAAGATDAQEWDVAPIDLEGATPPEACPLGDGAVGPADALVVLRRAVGLVTGFRCFGTSVSDDRVDVAPASEDGTTSPPTFTVVGDGQVTPADALLILRHAVGLIRLVSFGEAIDLGFAESGGPAAPVEASDADLAPLGNFPGDEDLDDGDGELDVRHVVLLPRVEATGAAPSTRLCAFAQHPGAGAPPALACVDVSPLAAGESSRVSLAIPTPGELGTVPVWLQLDADDAVSEADEENNVVRVDLAVIRPLPARPDLVFDALRPLAVTPPTPTSGQRVDIRARVLNQGDLTVPVPFAVDLFLDPLSPPPMLGDCGLFREAPAGLAPDEEFVVEFTGISLEGLSPGSHTLWGFVDSGRLACPGPDDVEESREDNNATDVPLGFCVASSASDPDGEIDLRADELLVTLEGPSFAVSGRFSNAGTRDVLPFQGDLPQEPASVQIAVEQPGTQTLVIEQERSCFIHGTQGVLAPGQRFSVAAQFPTTVRLRLDPERRLEEAEETNNELCVRVNPDGSLEPC